jgi:hypothetical protein
MPTWTVFIIIVVIVVAYYASTSYAKERRRDSVGDWFAKIPNFHANQVFIDVRGESAIGIDDRQRKLAVARRRQEPRSRVYSFAQVRSVALEENGVAIDQLPRRLRPPVEPSTVPADIASLYGSTAPEGALTFETTPTPGALSLLGARIVLDDPVAPELILRFYAGRPVDKGSLAADKAFGQARACMAAFDLVMKKASLARAGFPPV